VKTYGSLSTENALTIEEWKAEQQLEVFKKRLVPVNKPGVDGSIRTGEFFCEQAKQHNVTWPGSQLNMRLPRFSAEPGEISLDGEFDPGSG
jgi:hypothetical protein